MPDPVWGGCGWHPPHVHADTTAGHRTLQSTLRGLYVHKRHYRSDISHQGTDESQTKACNARRDRWGWLGDGHRRNSPKATGIACVPHASIRKAAIVACAPTRHHTDTSHPRAQTRLRMVFAMPACLYSLGCMRPARARRVCADIHLDVTP